MVDKNSLPQPTVTQSSTPPHNGGSSSRHLFWPKLHHHTLSQLSKGGSNCGGRKSWSRCLDFCCPSLSYRGLVVLLGSFLHRRLQELLPLLPPMWTTHGGEVNYK